MLNSNVPAYLWRESLDRVGVSSLVITAGCFGVDILVVFMSDDEEVGCDDASLPSCALAILLLLGNELTWRSPKN